MLRVKKKKKVFHLQRINVTSKIWGKNTYVNLDEEWASKKKRKKTHTSIMYVVIKKKNKIEFASHFFLISSIIVKE